MRVLTSSAGVFLGSCGTAVTFCACLPYSFYLTEEVFGGVLAQFGLLLLGAFLACATVGNLSGRRELQRAAGYGVVFLSVWALLGEGISRFFWANAANGSGSLIFYAHSLGLSLLCLLLPAASLTLFYLYASERVAPQCRGTRRWVQFAAATGLGMGILLGEVIFPITLSYYESREMAAFTCAAAGLMLLTFPPRPLPVLTDTERIERDFLPKRY